MVSSYQLIKWLLLAGFNYAYRRTATPTTAATPNSATSSLPNTQPNASVKPQIADKVIPPHMASRSDTSTPPAKELVKDSPSKVNGAPPATTSIDKAEKEKQKRKEKKERKERERAEREAKEAEESKDGATPAATEASTLAQAPKSGKATPISNPLEASTSAAELDSGLKSPATESTGGARTPTTKRGQKNPWTIFMRMSVMATEGELRDFFGDAKAGIIRVNFPQSYPGRAKIAYVEFGDEDAMRAGLEKHAEVRKCSNLCPWTRN